MTTDNIIRCTHCGGTALVPTLIGATGARGEGQPLPGGTDGFRCERCQRRYVLHGTVLTAVDDGGDS